MSCTNFRYDPYNLFVPYVHSAAASDLTSNPDATPSLAATSLRSDQASALLTLAACAPMSRPSSAARTQRDAVSPPPTMDRRHSASVSHQPYARLDALDDPRGSSWSTAAESVNVHPRSSAAAPHHERSRTGHSPQQLLTGGTETDEDCPLSRTLTATEPPAADRCALSPCPPPALRHDGTNNQHQRRALIVYHAGFFLGRHGVAPRSASFFKSITELCGPVTHEITAALAENLMLPSTDAIAVVQVLALDSDEDLELARKEFAHSTDDDWVLVAKKHRGDDVVLPADRGAFSDVILVGELAMPTVQPPTLGRVFRVAGRTADAPTRSLPAIQVERAPATPGGPNGGVIRWSTWYQTLLPYPERSSQATTPPNNGVPFSEEGSDQPPTTGGTVMYRNVMIGQTPGPRAAAVVDFCAQVTGIPVRRPCLITNPSGRHFLQVTVPTAQADAFIAALHQRFWFFLDGVVALGPHMSAGFVQLFANQQQQRTSTPKNPVVVELKALRIKNGKQRLWL